MNRRHNKSKNTNQNLQITSKLLIKSQIEREHMLFESDVIDAVCNYLETYGYEIQQRLNESQKGDDIIAVKNSQKFYIEAKGETSSLKTSNRYGKPFNRSQCKDHVANAFYRAAVMRSNSNAICGIALPKEKNHIEFIDQIDSTLHELGIEVFWIDSNKSVSVANHSGCF